MADDFKDWEIVNALCAAGVENWEGYEDAMDGVPEAEQDDDSVFLGALYEAGVDNWEGYEIAMETLRSKR